MKPGIRFLEGLAHLTHRIFFETWGRAEPVHPRARDACGESITAQMMRCAGTLQPQGSWGQPGAKLVLNRGLAWAGALEGSRQQSLLWTVALLGLEACSATNFQYPTLSMDVLIRLGEGTISKGGDQLLSRASGL